MNRRGILKGAVGMVALGLSTCGAVVGAASQAQEDHGHKPSMMRLHQAKGKVFDYTFLSEMVEHHTAATQMSARTLREAKREDVRAEARKIIAAQTKEKEQLARWSKAWYGKEPDPKLRQLVQKEMQPMMQAFLKDCRQDCDRTFLKHMSMHHQEGIMMAELARDKAVHPELKQLAGKMIRSQTNDIQKFQRMLDSQ